MKPEMSNLDVALSSFWQLARHWKQGDTAKLELSCEAGSLHLQLSAKLGHPDHIHFPQSLNSSSCKKKSPSQLRRQERRRQQALSKAANENVSQESDKNTFDNVPTSKEAEMLNETNENPKKKLTEKLVDSKLPIQSKQTSFKCDLCDYKGESSVGLRMHISRKHQDIPQIDGESFFVRETDCWWEKHFKSSLKNFQTYTEVLLDIDESPLSEEERCTERNIVTQARKEAFGENYSYFPPWSNN